MDFTDLKKAPGQLVEQVRSEMDQLLQRFFGPGRVGPLGVWAPQVDVEEGAESIAVKVDLPGVDPNDIEVAYVDGSLILRGRRNELREDTGKTYHCVERRVGQFYRSIPLPAGADPDTIQASCSKGVLTIMVPKKAAMQERKIAIFKQD